MNFLAANGVVFFDIDLSDAGRCVCPAKPPPWRFAAVGRALTAAPAAADLPTTKEQSPGPGLAAAGITLSV